MSETEKKHFYVNCLEMLCNGFLNHDLFFFVFFLLFFKAKASDSFKENLKSRGKALKPTPPDEAPSRLRMSKV
jgi:hypothetical protein